VMKIRIGDRVRTTRPGNRDSGLWGTVVRKMTRYVGRVPAIYLVWLDDGGGATIYNTRQCGWRWAVEQFLVLLGYQREGAL